MFGKVCHQICIDGLEASPCQLITIDPVSHKVVGANTRAVESLQRSFDELSAARLSDIFCERSVAAIRTSMSRIGFLKFKEKQLLGKMRCHDGKLNDVEISLKSTVDPRPLLIVVAIDVSEQLSAERRAEQARRTLEASIETLPHGFVLYSSEDRLVVCNEQYRQFYPKSAPAMVPGTTFEAILRYGLECGEYVEAIGQEATWLAERLRRHKAADKPVFQHLADGRRLQIIERQTPDGGRVGLRIDITDHLENLERAERAEQRLMDAIRALPAGFWLFDSEDRLVLFNERFRKMYGRSANILAEGRTYEEILKAGLERGQYPEAVGREKEWLAEIMATRQQDAYELVYQLDGGQWVRSLNERTSEGGHVGFRVDVTELKQRQLELEKAAMSDSLTGLLNRRGAQEMTGRLRSTLKTDAQLAFLHIDLDRFKPINDVFGHQFGDKLLVHVAKVLVSNTRDTDIVARIGGDEFLICQVSDYGSSDAMHLAERIRQKISEPCLIDGKSCHVGASVGLARWRFDDSRSLSEAMQDADIALNASKDLGRDTVLEFEPSMREHSVRIAKIAEDVARGLKASEFTAYFQPLFDAEQMQATGFECLARWRHQKHGVLTPGYFLSACEASGVVGAIDRAVLNEAVSFAASLRAEGRGDLRISLNLSSAQLKHPNVVDQYLWIFDKRDVEPTQFRIEILESTLLEERASHVVDNIRRFRDEGFLIDLDDFGTGHTAIASLRRFPVDRIKVDRSLVSGINTDKELAILTEAVVSLGRRLGLKVLAEGIECLEEYEALQEMGCTCVQGFYFARPMSSQDCLSWLSDHDAVSEHVPKKRVANKVQ